MVHPIRLASVLAFLAFPILEIGLLIRVGQSIGFWRLAAIVVITAMLGSAVIRRTGLAVLAKARRQYEEGLSDGSNPLLDGFLQVTAGMFLIFPGLISDVFGIVLLVPAVRHLIVTKVLPRFFSVTTFSTGEAYYDAGDDPDPAASRNGPFDATFDKGKTIEGEYERVSEKTIHAERVPQRAAPQQHRRRSAR